MSIQSYLSRCGFNADAFSADFYQQVTDFQQQLAALTPAAAVQWQFRVPELGEGGSCSLFGQLADEPYDLRPILGGQTDANQQLLAKVTAIVQFYQANSASHWFGVYQRRNNPAGETVLVKLAYFGAESRAEFPLTAEFAAISNNSTVGLSGQGRIINDVAVYLAQGGEYYTCDPKVQAEACLPLVGASGEVVGIIDSEAFTQNLFHGKELALLIAVALTLPALLA
ncbi:histidine kinase [Rheinheimera sp. F8]|uniref:GAF domain-containing protein n=1 Tax=Rheinheimera sp. F8 TaxID=1763998 RepID=UPI000744CF0F|nr:histidine kinase [Rheinheimera sp. F8]ALZ74621.1 histidine kinase [Rheinheimera sp. F8]